LQSYIEKKKKAGGREEKVKALCFLRKGIEFVI